MKTEIISQYRAALKMLINSIEKCLEDEWENKKYEDAYWRLVYHALYYTDLYLSQSPASFTPWEKHRENYHFLGVVTRDDKPILIDRIYSKKELIEYTEFMFNRCERSVNETTLEDKSGFKWLSMNKLEVHLYNIRHLQHHIGQLIERLHQAEIRGIKWESTG